SWRAPSPAPCWPPRPPAGFRPRAALCPKGVHPRKAKKAVGGKRPGVPWSAGPFCGRRALLQAHFIFAAFILQEKKNADFVGLTIRREADKINLV
ncbi:hypothetical protein, partial [Anaerotruncus massiliensis (ex Liu et al. 2021)]|uniref:hypothetical protein n=2 Tax=Anaerotruncus massiliensis (ex Liu et al. 2021) TaxID=2321404 RepID=UPI003AB89B94